MSVGSQVSRPIQRSVDTSIDLHVRVAQSLPIMISKCLLVYLLLTDNVLAGCAQTKKDGALMKFAMCVHNAFLCLLSAAMCAGAGYEAYLRSQKDGVRWLFCEEIGTAASGGVFYWSYIYYLSKFVEFIDTLFKVFVIHALHPPHPRADISRLCPPPLPSPSTRV